MAQPDEEGQQDRGITEHEAAAQLHGLMAESPPEEGENEEVESPDAEQASPEPEEAPEPVEGPEAEDFGTEESEDVEAEREADDAPSESELPQTVTVKVAGEEEEVPLEEVTRGYQRQEDYTRKTQEVAEQREAVEQRAEALRAEREQYAQGLQVIEQTLGALAPEKPDPELRETNPSEYAERFAEWEKRQEQIQQVQQERQKTIQQHQEELQERKQKVLQREQEKLKSAIPEWVDEDTARQEKEQMAQYATEELGFEPERLSEVTDHRVVVLLRKAMKYDQLSDKSEEVTAEKKQEKPTTLEPGSRSGSKSESKSDPSSEAIERLKQTGSTDDAAEAIHHILNS